MTKERTGEVKMARDYNELDDGKDHGNDCEGLQTSEQQEDQNWIKVMETIVKAIRQIHSEILLTIQTDENTQNKLENLMSDMRVATFNLRERLYKMEKNIDQQEEMYKSLEEVPLAIKSEPASLRMMRVTHSTLKHKFCTIMQEYNSMQVEYINRCRERIGKEVHVIGRDGVDHELEELFEQPLESVFVNTLNEQAQLTMDDVDARHRDILKLELSIRQVRELFFHLSIIVEKQRSIVDDIESNMNATENYVGRARKVVQEAKKTRMSARKKSLCLLVGLAVVVTVIVVVILKA